MTEALNINRVTMKIEALNNFHLFDNGYRVYTEGFKPTPAAIGAVKLAGDTMTGNLTVPAVLVSAAQNTAANALVRKDYVDGMIGGLVNPTGVAPIAVNGSNVISISSATTSAAGSMSAADKTKLDGLPTGAVKAKKLHAADWTSAAGMAGNDHVGGYHADCTGLTGARAYISFGATGSGTPTVMDMYIDGEIYAQNGANKVYHQAFKPTPGDIGAVAKSGDTMTGTLTMTGTFAASTANAMLAMHGNGSIASGTQIILRSMRENNSSTWLWEKIANGSLYYGSGTTGSVNKVRLDASGGELYLQDATKKVYHQGFKPTAADVGAVAKSGDTMTGVLTVPLHQGLRTAAGTEGQYVAISAEGSWSMLWRKNGDATVKADEFIGIDLNSQLKFRQDKGLGDGTYNDRAVYHEGKKQPHTIGTPTELGANVDLDTLTTPGVYSQSMNAETSTALHYPEANAGSLVVYQAAGVVQEYRVYNSSRIWTRAKYNSSAWTAWAKQYNTLNKPNAADVGALALTGGTVTGDTIFNAALKVGSAKFFMSGVEMMGAAADTTRFGDGTFARPLNLNALNGEAYVQSSGGTKHRIYHQGFKPTATDVGAAPVSHQHNTVADIAGILNLLFPVGSTIYRVDTKTPTSLGYPGTWTKVAASVTLATGAADGSDVGTTSGTNAPAVPVPSHTHTATTTATQPAHSHSGSTDSQGAHTHPVSVRIRGDFFWGNSHPVAQGGAASEHHTDSPYAPVAESAGAHAHNFSTASATPTITATTTVAAAGVASPTIDVQGLHLNGTLWIRTV